MGVYESILQRQPLSTAAGDRALAAQFVAVLSAAIEAKTADLSDSQRNYLYKLRTKWDQRAKGEDSNWNLYGSRPGRRKSVVVDKAATVDPTVYGTEEQRDPLLSSLMRKFGKPLRTDDI